MALFQILQRRPPVRGVERPRWQFSAHGAAYTEEEAQAWMETLDRHGWQVKRIRL
jgi:hypothetical protein